MLLALAASPEDLEVMLISVTYGNIDVQNCLRNVVSLFHHIEKEMEWRKANGRPVGFEALTKSKPLVAIGPEHPLADQMLMADYFRMCLKERLPYYRTDRSFLDGTDGLGGISETVCNASITFDVVTVTDPVSIPILHHQTLGRTYSTPQAIQRRRSSKKRLKANMHYSDRLKILVIKRSYASSAKTSLTQSRSPLLAR